MTFPFEHDAKALLLSLWAVRPRLFIDASARTHVREVTVWISGEIDDDDDEKTNTTPNFRRPLGAVLAHPPVSGCVRALAGRLRTSWPPTCCAVPVGGEARPVVKTPIRCDGSSFFLPRGDGPYAQTAYGDEHARPARLARLWLCRTATKVSGLLRTNSARTKLLRRSDDYCRL